MKSHYLTLLFILMLAVSGVAPATSTGSVVVMIDGELLKIIKTDPMPASGYVMIGNQRFPVTMEGTEVTYALPPDLPRQWLQITVRLHGALFLNHWFGKTQWDNRLPLTFDTVAVTPSLEDRQNRITITGIVPVGTRTRIITTIGNSTSQQHVVLGQTFSVTMPRDEFNATYIVLTPLATFSDRYRGSIIPARDLTTTVTTTKTTVPHSASPTIMSSPPPPATPPFSGSTAVANATDEELSSLPAPMGQQQHRFSPSSPMPTATTVQNPPDHNHTLYQKRTNGHSTRSGGHLPFDARQPGMPVTAKELEPAPTSRSRLSSHDGKQPTLASFEDFKRMTETSRTLHAVDPELLLKLMKFGMRSRVATRIDLAYLETLLSEYFMQIGSSWELSRSGDALHITQERTVFVWDKIVKTYQRRVLEKITFYETEKVVKEIVTYKKVTKRVLEGYKQSCRRMFWGTIRCYKTPVYKYQTQYQKVVQRVEETIQKQVSQYRWVTKTFTTTEWVRRALHKTDYLFKILPDGRVIPLKDAAMATYDDGSSSGNGDSGCGNPLDIDHLFDFLNCLWDQVIETITSIATGIADFFITTVVAPVKALLDQFTATLVALTQNFFTALARPFFEEVLREVDAIIWSASQILPSLQSHYQSLLGDNVTVSIFPFNDPLSALRDIGSGGGAGSGMVTPIYRIDSVDNPTDNAPRLTSSATNAANHETADGTTNTNTLDPPAHVGTVLPMTMGYRTETGLGDGLLGELLALYVYLDAQAQVLGKLNDLADSMPLIDAARLRPQLLDADALTLQTATWLLVFDTGTVDKNGNRKTEPGLKWVVVTKGQGGTPSKQHEAFDATHHIPTGISLQGYVSYSLDLTHTQLDTNQGHVKQIAVIPHTRLMMLPDSLNPFDNFRYDQARHVFTDLEDANKYHKKVLTTQKNVLKKATVLGTDKTFLQYLADAKGLQSPDSLDLSQVTIADYRKAIDLALGDLNINLDLNGAWNHIKTQYESDHPQDATSVLKIAPASTSLDDDFREGYLYEAWDVPRDDLAYDPLSPRQINLDALDERGDSKEKTRLQQAGTALIYGVAFGELFDENGDLKDDSFVGVRGTRVLSMDEYFQKLRGRLQNDVPEAGKDYLKRVITQARREAYVRIYDGISSIDTQHTLRGTQIGQFRDLILATSLIPVHVTLADGSDVTVKVKHIIDPATYAKVYLPSLDPSLAFLYYMFQQNDPTTNSRAQSLHVLFQDQYLEKLRPSYGLNKVKTGFWTLLKRGDTTKDTIKTYLDKALVYGFATKVAQVALFLMAAGYDLNDDAFNEKVVTLELTGNDGSTHSLGLSFNDLLHFATTVITSDALSGTNVQHMTSIFNDGELFQKLFNIPDSEWKAIEDTPVIKHWKVAVETLLGGVIADDNHWYPSEGTKTAVDKVLTNQKLNDGNEKNAAAIMESVVADLNSEDVRKDIDLRARPEITKDVLLKNVLEKVGISSEHVAITARTTRAGTQADYDDLTIAYKAIGRFIMAWITFARAKATDALGNGEKIEEHIYNEFYREHVSVGSKSSKLLQSEWYPGTLAWMHSTGGKHTLAILALNEERKDILKRIDDLKNLETGTKETLKDHVTSRFKVFQELIASQRRDFVLKAGLVGAVAVAQALRNAAALKQLGKTLGIGTLQAMAARIMSEFGRSLGEALLFTFPELWSGFLSDPGNETKTLNFYGGLLRLMVAYDQQARGLTTWIKVPSYLRYIDLLQPDQYGMTWTGVALGIALSALVTLLSTYEFEGAEGSPIGLIATLMAALLGGLGGTLQTMARVPFFPGPMFAAVIGDILKRILTGGLDALGVLPQEVRDLLNAFGNLVIDAFFSWQVPVLDQTLFELTLTFISSGFYELVFDAVFTPLMDFTADAIMGAFHDWSKELLVSYLLPPYIRAMVDDSYFEGLRVLPTGRQITGGNCECVKTRE